MNINLNMENRTKTANMGWAFLRLLPSKSESGTMGLITTEKSDKKRNVYSVDDNVRRAMEIHDALDLQLSMASGITAICAEAMSFPRSSKVSAQIAMTWGVICSLCKKYKISLLQVSPQQAKVRVCGIKTASKLEIQAALDTAFPNAADNVSHLPKSKWEHPYDALAAALACSQDDSIQMVRRLLL